MSDNKKKRNIKTSRNRNTRGADTRKNRKRSVSGFRYAYRRKLQNTSIYFLVLSVITAFAVVLAIVFGFTQNMLFSRTYRKEAAKEVKGKGEAIEAQVKGLPVEFGGNYSAYLRVLARTYDVSLYLLNEQGDVLYPREEGFDPNAPEIQETLDFSKVMEEMLQKMEREKQATVVYEGDGEYVYGSKVVLPGDAETYLYVGKSLELINTVNAQIGVRMTLLAVFIIVLAFALSSAVSGWLTRPLQEITEKAQQLGKGDFNVDFHGADYAEEIVELADTLNYARDELAKTDGMQKELIANVSHDFKTPLTMIKAYASMIQEISGDIPEKRNKHAQVIVEEADRLTSLVEDVLDLSKIRSGIETLKTEKLDMSAYLYEILARFDYLKETKNYRFVTDIEEGLCACADKLKIGQVLYNLIGNAVNYTGEDAVVYVSLKKKSEQEFVFSVRDTGKGIKQEELASVWDRYYRSSEMHKRPVKGTGLGLSIVKTVLEKHKFPFGVESTVGKGSTFYVIFPLSADVKEETDS